MHFSPHQLLLFPVAANSATGYAGLAATLAGLGLLGEPLGNGRHATGSAFPSLLCFLGCAPDIELEPHPSKPFCYIELPNTDMPRTFQPLRKPAFQRAMWVAIGNVHEAEAVPAAALLESLAVLTACRWKYTYLNLSPRSI